MGWAQGSGVQTQVWAKRTCFFFNCEASPCCVLLCAIFLGGDAARCEPVRSHLDRPRRKVMMSTVIGGAMLPHAPQFFTMPETEDKKNVEHVREVAADIGGEASGDFAGRKFHWKIPSEIGFE